MDVIEQAEHVSRQLAYHKQLSKAIEQGRKIEKGRGSDLLTQALDLQPRQVAIAIERLEKDRDDNYTSLSYNLNKHAREE